MSEVNPSYDGARADLIKFAGFDLTGRTILDVGCYRGANADYLKSRYSDITYIGIENDPKAAWEASSSVDKLVNVDLDKFSRADISFVEKIDLVILGDVLEHLKEPGHFLQELSSVINHETVIVVSIPNIQFYETFFLLLIGRFPRRERGIFDRTHLRWFTFREFKELASDRFDIVDFERVYRLVEKPSRINKLTRFFYPVIIVFRPFFTFQMHFALKKKRQVS